MHMIHKKNIIVSILQFKFVVSNFKYYYCPDSSIILLILITIPTITSNKCIHTKVGTDKIWR